jgi:hypothetical protein
MFLTLHSRFVSIPFLLLPFGFAIATVRAQQTLQQAGTGRVVLASVVNRQGGPILDVGVDDFVVEENGRARDVLDVHVADYPVALIVDDGVDLAAMTAMKSAAARFVARVGERPVAIGTFSRPGDSVAGFETERSDLLRRLGALEAAPPGDAQPVNRITALTAAARLVREAQVPFSAIVVITTHAIEPSANVSPEAIAEILGTGANVHVISARGQPSDEQSAAPGSTDLLRVLASQTRGQYTPIFALASYGVALDRIADRMATELMIEYVAPAGSPSADVKVGVKLPGARVLGLGVR